MPSKSKSSETTNAGDEAIRQRAYLLWEAEGRKDGMADHYWHRAATEIAVNGSAKVKARPAKKTEAVAAASKVVKKAEAKPRAAVGTRKPKAPAN